MERTPDIALSVAEAGRRAHTEPERGAHTEAERLEREAWRALAEVRLLQEKLHEPGRRERYRRLLEFALDHAERALATTTDLAIIVHARAALALAGARKAEDALHGAGQLSQSAQRAPTLEACDDGWRRVESIVAGAESAAHIAVTNAVELETVAPRLAIARRSSRAARQAETAARAARRIVEERNHAYTFHADSAFSFGEGWYLAAAAVLAGVAIQIEPGKDGTVRAEKFLRDAGLGDRLQPYRPRPRAMKHTTELVGRAFRADAAQAQKKLRAAFLGEGPIPSAIVDDVDQRLLHAPGEQKVLLWVRDGAHHPGRNTSHAEILELSAAVRAAGLVPVVTGDAIRGGDIPPGTVDLILFWKDSIFRQEDQRRAQLQFFEVLRERHGLVGQIGVTTAGMDGPALMGLPTLYLTDQPNVRMREWVGAVPGYQEVVRGSDHLERVARVFLEWRSGRSPDSASASRSNVTRMRRLV